MLFFIHLNHWIIVFYVILCNLPQNWTIIFLLNTSLLGFFNMYRFVIIYNIRLCRAIIKLRKIKVFFNYASSIAVKREWRTTKIKVFVLIFTLKFNWRIVKISHLYTFWSSHSNLHLAAKVVTFKIVYTIVFIEVYRRSFFI